MPLIASSTRFYSSGSLYATLGSNSLNSQSSMLSLCGIVSGNVRGPRLKSKPDCSPVQSFDLPKPRITTLKLLSLLEDENNVILAS